MYDNGKQNEAVQESPGSAVLHYFNEFYIDFKVVTVKLRLLIPYFIIKRAQWSWPFSDCIDLL